MSSYDLLFGCAVPLEDLKQPGDERTLTSSCEDTTLWTEHDPMDCGAQLSLPEFLPLYHVRSRNTTKLACTTARALTTQKPTVLHINFNEPLPETVKDVQFVGLFASSTDAMDAICTYDTSVARVALVMVPFVEQAGSAGVKETWRFGTDLESCHARQQLKCEVLEQAIKLRVKFLPAFRPSHSFFGAQGKRDTKERRGYDVTAISFYYDTAQSCWISETTQAPLEMGFWREKSGKPRRELNEKRARAAADDDDAEGAKRARARQRTK
jgi:hypothetical protein